MPVTATTATSSASGWRARATTKAVDQAEEAGQAKIGHHDHHAEQQRDGAHVDGGEGLAHVEDAEGDHQAGAEQRGAGAVEPPARQAAQRHDQIGGGENDDGDHGARTLSCRQAPG